jgi:hypothetical protein
MTSFITICSGFEVIPYPNEAIPYPNGTLEAHTTLECGLGRF